MELELINRITKGIKDNLNGPLKQFLKYTEKYEMSEVAFSPYEDTTITFFPEIIFRSPNTLIAMLQRDPSLKEKIRSNLLQGLQSKYPGIQNVRIILSSDDISFIIKMKPFPLGDIPDSGIYVNIASYLSIDKLNNLCRTDKKFNQLCRNNSFWINLINKKIPGYTVPDIEKILGKKINYENFYKGLVYSKEFEVYFKATGDDVSFYRRDEYPKWETLQIDPRTYFRGIFEYPDTLSFLIYTNEISLDFIEYYFSTIFYYVDVDILKMIDKKFPKFFDIETLEDIRSTITGQRESIPNMMEKYFWIQEKLGISLTHGYLLKELDSENNSFVKKLIKYLPEDIDINRIVDIINDEIEGANVNEEYNLTKAKELYYRYQDKFDIETIKQFLMGMFQSHRDED